MLENIQNNNLHFDLCCIYLKYCVFFFHYHNNILRFTCIFHNVISINKAPT